MRSNLNGVYVRETSRSVFVEEAEHLQSPGKREERPSCANTAAKNMGATSEVSKLLKETTFSKLLRSFR